MLSWSYLLPVLDAIEALRLWRVEMPTVQSMGWQLDVPRYDGVLSIMATITRRRHS